MPVWNARWSKMRASLRFFSSPGRASGCYFSIISPPEGSWFDPNKNRVYAGTSNGDHAWISLAGESPYADSRPKWEIAWIPTATERMLTSNISRYGLLLRRLRKFHTTRNPVSIRRNPLIMCARTDGFASTFIIYSKDLSILRPYYMWRHALIFQLVESLSYTLVRMLCEEEVGGSRPPESTRASLAQLVSASAL